MSFTGTSFATQYNYDVVSDTEITTESVGANPGVLDLSVCTNSGCSIDSGDRIVVYPPDCAERVVALFEAEAPGDHRPHELIARARAFARGELNTADEIRRRFKGGVPSSEGTAPAAAAAARAAGQAAATCHMGAHALGAAAYAVRAASLAEPGRPGVVGDEIRWQVTHMTGEVRAALSALPKVGENSSGPLGPGLLASGQLAAIVRELQTGLAESG